MGLIRTHSPGSFPGDLRDRRAATVIALVLGNRTAATVLIVVIAVLLLVAAVAWRWKRIMEWLADQLPSDRNTKLGGDDPEELKRRRLNLALDELTGFKDQLTEPSALESLSRFETVGSISR